MFNFKSEANKENVNVAAKFDAGLKNKAMAVDQNLPHNRQRMQARSSLVGASLWQGVSQKPGAFTIFEDSCTVYDQTMKMKSKNQLAAAAINKKSSCMNDRERHALFGPPVQRKDSLLVTKNQKLKAKPPTSAAFGSDNPCLSECFPYPEEYLEYVIDIERKKSKNLQSAAQEEYLTSDQLRLIIKFVFQIGTKHKISSFLTLQTVEILKKYLKKKRVPLEEIKLNVLAALWIAMKKELGEFNLASDFIQCYIKSKPNHPDFNDIKRSLLQAERNILMALSFDLSFVDPFSLLVFFSPYSKKFTDDQHKQQYYFGSYIVDLSMMENFFSVSIIRLVLVAAEISLGLAREKNYASMSWDYYRKIITSQKIMSQSLKEFCISEGGKSLNEELRIKIFKSIMESAEPERDHHVVYKKYTLGRFGAISKILVEKVGQLESHDKFN